MFIFSKKTIQHCKTKWRKIKEMVSSRKDVSKCGVNWLISEEHGLKVMQKHQHPVKFTPHELYAYNFTCKHECYTFIFVKFTNTCLPVLIGHEKSVLQQMQQRNIPGPHRSSEK